MNHPDSTQAVRQAMSSLCPDGVCVQIAMASAAYEAIGDEFAHIEKAVEHRRNEFVTGRHCLRSAMAELDYPAQAILPDSDGVPQLPDSVLGSISHSRGLCLAIAAKSADYSYLAVDVEKTNRLSIAARKRVVHPVEAEWCAENQLRASVLFSMKEAFYKAQFPSTRLSGNFQDLALVVNDSTQCATVHSVSDTFREALGQSVVSFQFRYCLVGDYVVSLCYY